MYVVHCKGEFRQVQGAKSCLAPDVFSTASKIIGAGTGGAGGAAQQSYWGSK